MVWQAETRTHDGGTHGRHGLTDEEFVVLMREARAEARRCRVGRPPADETDFALRTQHAEFGAAAH
ncbi:hypothetical protein [Streptomyces roseicoloratus]|uniref:Uncharacterized protein n=1 Tax=Streptomyces roseicoloratus TaxID=2508722 RepID=A0ABY9S1L8_9ACTN|nr:hypothetical protein [Streptomyces roseicoloratus]WMX48326.1 hypothetical protein RGF97_30925 [Streptomyces roseicoloratus]